MTHRRAGGGLFYYNLACRSSELEFCIERYPHGRERSSFSCLFGGVMQLCPEATGREGVSGKAG